MSDNDQNVTKDAKIKTEINTEMIDSSSLAMEESVTNETLFTCEVCKSAFNEFRAYGEHVIDCNVKVKVEPKLSEFLKTEPLDPQLGQEVDMEDNNDDYFGTNPSKNYASGEEETFSCGSCDKQFGYFHSSKFHICISNVQDFYSITGPIGGKYLVHRNVSRGLWRN